MAVELRQAVAEQSAELTEVAFAAKRRWGYPEDWIRLWEDELTIGPGYVDTHIVVAAVEAGRIVGWCALEQDDDGCWLDYCWVLPAASGAGIGRRLVQHALELAAQLRAPASG